MSATAEETAPASGADGSAHDFGDNAAGRRVLGAVIVIWVVLLALLLRHREVLSSDTLSNYVHVWFIQDRMWHGHGLPLEMPVLGHGEAYTFPYAFIPWMVAALLWPLLGEYAVGVCLGAGWVFLVAGTFYAFPELKRGWWAAAVLISPALITGVLLGQLPFLWAAGMFLAAIASWRRGRRKSAVALAALAQVTHAAVLMPLVGLIVVWRLRADPSQRKQLFVAWIVSVIPALPAALLVFVSPVTEETSPLFSLWIEFETLVLRSLFLLVPLALLYLRARGDRRAPMLAVAGLVVFQLATIPVTSLRLGWGAITRTPDEASSAMAESVHIDPGKVYRVLAFGDRKWGPYSIVRRGGTLDSELFPESLHWRSFKDEAEYARFLIRRRIDVVLVQSKYHSYKTNEQALLDAIAATTGCVDGVATTRTAHTKDYTAYAVTRGCSGPPH
ncbi:MAG: hypothetical protein ACR2LQ_13600 [Acidimicrobiales bacterium]